MTDNKVVTDLTSDNAVLLLEAAEKLGYEPRVVAVTEDGFSVPEDVFDKAGFKDSDGDNDPAELEFSSKAKAKEYADANDLDVDESLHADEYKEAVVAAAKEKGLTHA